MLLLSPDYAIITTLSLLLLLSPDLNHNTDTFFSL